MTNLIHFIKRFFHHHDNTEVPDALLQDIGFPRAFMYLP
jgi:hypothetical protein